MKKRKESNFKETEVPSLFPNQICHSLYSQLYNSNNDSLEMSVLDRLIIPKLIFFFILITYLVDILLIF